MNPLKKLMSWWRGPTDPESVAATVDAQHLSVNRDTIKISQNTVGRYPLASPGLLPTPDVLDPGSEDSRNYR
jgi:hypothetical protein